MRLTRYVRVPYRKVLLTRRNVLRRDGHRCVYCGATERLTLDHVLPKSRGGPDAWENLVAACTPCNNRKGNRTPEEAGMRMSRRPFRPSHVMYMRDLIGVGGGGLEAVPVRGVARCARREWELGEWEMAEDTR